MHYQTLKDKLFYTVNPLRSLTKRWKPGAFRYSDEAPIQHESEIPVLSAAPMPEVYEQQLQIPFYDTGYQMPEPVLDTLPVQLTAPLRLELPEAMQPVQPDSVEIAHAIEAVQVQPPEPRPLTEPTLEDLVQQPSDLFPPLFGP